MTKLLARATIAALVLILAGCASMSGSTSSTKPAGSSGGMSGSAESSPYRGDR